MLETATDIEYSSEDLKVLASMCNQGSAIPVELKDMGYDPVKFKSYMKQLPKQYKFLYQTSFDDVLCNQMNNPAIQRFMTWRTSIGK